MVVLTANGNEEVAQQCEEAGSDLFLTKPFRNVDVEALVLLARGVTPMDEEEAAGEMAGGVPHTPSKS